MDLKILTPEERGTLASLARSPGWALLVEKLFLPQIQLATRFLDRPAAEQSGRGDWMRGVKAAYMNLVEVVYHVAGIENPFVRHGAGLLASVRNAEDGSIHKEWPDNQDFNKEITKTAQEERIYRARASYPV